MNLAERFQIICLRYPDECGVKGLEPSRKIPRVLDTEGKDGFQPVMMSFKAFLETQATIQIFGLGIFLRYLLDIYRHSETHKRVEHVKILNLPISLNKLIFRI